MKRNLIISFITIGILVVILCLELGRKKKPGWEFECKACTDKFLSLLLKDDFTECYLIFGKNENWQKDMFVKELSSIKEKYGKLHSYEYKGAYESNNAYIIDYKLVSAKGKYSAKFRMAEKNIENQPDCSRIFNFGITGFAGEQWFNLRIIK